MSSTDTVAVARGDLRLLVLAAGLVVADFDVSPEVPAERTDGDNEFLGNLADAGLLVDDGVMIDVDPLRGALARTRDLVIDDPADSAVPVLAEA